MSDQFIKLLSSMDQLSKALCGKENATFDELLQAASQLKSRLAQVEREKDALMNDLLAADQIDCIGCAHNQNPEPCDMEYDTCASPCACFRCKNNNLYEWRGICPENTKEDSTC